MLNISLLCLGLCFIALLSVLFLISVLSVTQCYVEYLYADCNGFICTQSVVFHLMLFIDIESL